MPALISADGRWWWDGTQWKSRVVEGQLDLFWFNSTPEWFTRVIVTGLIGLIPIVGAINLLGWTLTATDMVRRGWKELPPAGFQYLERGVAPFVVGLVYALVVFFVVGALAFFTVLVAISGGSRALLAVGFGLLAVLVILVWWLVSLYLYAAVIIGSDRLGIARAIDPRRLFALAAANQETSLRVGLILGAASIAVAAITLTVGVVIPFGGLVVSIGLPAVYAMIVPKLALFRVEAQTGDPPT